MSDQYNPASSAGRVAKHAESHNTFSERVCENPARRKRLEKDAEKWLKWYLSGSFTRKFERPQKEIIRGSQQASDNGSRFVVAGERGIGKSAVLWGMILFFKLTGQHPFPICVPWADGALKRAFRFWKTALCYNVRLLADYPEYCQPFYEARGIPQRVPNIIIIGSDGTKRMPNAQLTSGQGIIAMPDNLGCIGGATINGNVRGLNHPQADGTILRPSIALVDDIQDRKVAKSPDQITTTISIIDGDVGGCGEVGKDLPMLMACNCIETNDVACHYLNHAEWHALRISCVEQWPDGWDDADSECRQLWEELHEKMLSKDNTVAFYKKHRAVMTKGMKLSAPGVFKKSAKCPDAFYGVMRMYYRMGREAFLAERQQNPVDKVAEAGPYTLTPAIIQSRANKGQKMYDLPDWVTRRFASSDVNPSYAFSTVVFGFGEDQSASIPWYGLHRTAINESVPEAVRAQALFSELTKHGKALSELPCRPEAWAIDAGGKQFDAVVRFCSESVRLCGIQAYAFTGRGAKQYRPYGKTLSGQPKEQCHGCIDRKQGRHIRWVAWNADYWKEMAQRAWLGEIGSPGAVSVYDGSHTELANQICRERLIAKGEIGGQMFWNFHRQPGKNDFGDAMAQGYALAAYCGIGTGGTTVRRIQRPRRKAKVPIQ